MWCWLRNRRFAGLKFRRQVPIGRYIVDFYCAELKLVIELDGTHHRSPGTDEYDDRRTSYLHQCGMRVLRVPNEILIRDSEIVVEMIQEAIDRSVKSRAEKARSREIQPPHPPVGTFSPAEKRGGEGLSWLEQGDSLGGLRKGSSRLEQG